MRSPPSWPESDETQPPSVEADIRSETAPEPGSPVPEKRSRPAKRLGHRLRSAFRNRSASSGATAGDAPEVIGKRARPEGVDETDAIGFQFRFARPPTGPPVSVPQVSAPVPYEIPPHLPFAAIWLGAGGEFRR